ncbi:MAG: DUF1501 domain-containing protein [Alphaproteobacteria bacterium]|nr:MAG: DUF1501 domain-containing protein [Alphaproteobacteria bacterium]
MPITRRDLLASGLAIGCSAAASPLMTPVVLAAAPGENRLVVIILRGALDGLDLLRPAGDPLLPALRPNLFAPDAPGHDLDGFFTLHPALEGLAPLWRAGQLAFVAAVSTPYRGRRSHFDGQDLLETGGDSPDGQLPPSRDGWLNRALRLIPGADLRTAFAVGQENLLLLDGPAPVSSWSPEAELPLSPQARLLLERLYARDPLFAEAAQRAFEIAEEASASATGGLKGAAALAAFAADRLNEETRIAAFSIGGWDTHRAQDRALPRALGELSAALLTLRERLGGNWDRTAVVAVTEFGRTVRENGSRGTDHGTGGTMLLAGGVLSGARVHGRWPGLGEGALLEDRDLMPTDDVRRPLGWLLAGLFGLPRADIEASVFPRLEMGADPRLLA